MTSNNDIHEYKLLDEILSSKNKEIIDIINNILNNYKIDTDILLKQTSHYLCDTTDFFWEPVTKEEKYSNTYTEYPAYPSNHLAWTWKEKTVTVKGKKESKTIRCANHDLFFYITEQVKDYTPQDITPLNPGLYESVSYQDILNINIKSDNNTIDKEIIKQALIHTYKELLFNNIHDILNDYYNELDKYKEELLQRIEKEKQNIIENERVLLIVKDQIDIYQRVLTQLEPFDIDEFNNYNYKLNNTKEYRKKMDLASFEDVTYETEYYEACKEDAEKILDKKKLNIKKDDKNRLGWDTYFDFYVSDDNHKYNGYIEKFIEIPTELLSLINHINNFLMRLSFKYDNDSNYDEISYNRKSFDSSLKYGSFKTYLNGKLKCYVNNERIKEHELYEQLSFIEKLIDAIQKYNIENLLDNKEIQKEMKNKIISNYNLSENEIKLLDEDISHHYNWNLYCPSYDKERILDYCKEVEKLIKQVKEIIQMSHENTEKADYFKKYVDFYNRLYTKYAAIKQYNILIDKCNQKKKNINNNIDNSNRNIESMTEQCHEIDTTKKTIKQYTKRRD